MCISQSIIGNKPSAVILCPCGFTHVFLLDQTIQFLTLICDCGTLVCWARSEETINDASAIIQMHQDGK